MNPFLFKAHPLLQTTIGCVTGSGCSSGVWVGLLTAYLLLNLPLAVFTLLRVKRLLHIRLRFTAAYLVSLPVTILFIPNVLTLLSDVMHHAFQLENRVIFLFALFVATVLLAALVGNLVHYRNGEPIRSEHGLTVVLNLLLACVPYALLLLSADALIGVLPGH